MRILSLLLLLVIASPVFAEPAENAAYEAQLAALPKPADLVATDPAGWKQINGNGENSAWSVVDVAEMPFKQAIQIETKKRVDRDYMIQFSRPNTGEVKTGDVLMLTFYARAIQSIAETGLGQVNVSFFTTEEPRDRAGRAEVLVDANWKKYYVPWAVLMKHHPAPVPPGKMILALAMGVPPQIVQIADVRVLDFPPGVSAAALPHEENTYAGREPNAAWRAAAAARIEENRKGDLTIQVVDAAGKAVSGAQVHVEMKKHAFGFGSAFSDNRIVKMKDADADRYREEFPKLFNCGTIESGLKWTEWVKNRDIPVRALAWMDERGVRVRGHNLVCPQWNRITFLGDAEYNLARQSPRDLQKILLDHIRDELTPLAGRCYQWDVVNEPMSHKDFLNFQGPQAIVEWFKLAHEIDPKAQLIVNDITLHMPNGGPGGSAIPPEDDFYFYLKYLKDHGAPFAGFGLESHLARMTPPEEILRQFDRYAAFGPINITEFDASVDDEQLQADMTRDYLTVCFSHPAVANFVMWGFWDGQHWRKNAPIFRKDWSLKPSGQVYRDLVFKKWWTDQTSPADAAGNVKTRGFLGDYVITATHDGKSATQPIALTREGTSAKLVIK